jgi:flagellar motility protein MotE (MotC chaperone)
VKRPRNVRLLPTVIATGAVVLGLKAVAVAEGASEAATTAASQPEAAATESAGAAPAAAQSCPPASFADSAGLSASEVQVLQALGARREALDAREAEISTSAQMLTVAERRLEERLARLKQLEDSVNALLGQLDEAQAARIGNLVDVYQRMRAKDAAAVFDQLDEQTLSLVASRMRQQNLAEVMGRMDPARARRLTQMLAELSRSTPDAASLLAQSGAGVR